jgi:hypothetical protein
LYLGAFFHLRFIINPRLVYDSQQPAFLTTPQFLQQFLAYPGGPLDYCSAFLSQLLYDPLGGTVLILAILGIINFQCRDILQRIGAPSAAVALAAAFPSLVLLGLHGNYTHPISYDVRFALSLLGFQLAIRTPVSLRLVRPLASAALACLLYYLGGVFALAPYALLSISYFVMQGTVAGRVIDSVSVVSAAILLPLAVYHGPFMVTFHKDLEYLNELWRGYAVAGMPLLVFFFLPLTIPLIAAVQRYRLRHPVNQPTPVKNAPTHPSKGKKGKRESRPAPIAKPVRKISALPFMAVIVTMLAIIFAWISFDRRENFILRIDRYADRGQWRQLLHTARSGKYTNDREVCLQVNRALFYTGQMGERLFAYNQVWCTDGLLPNNIYVHYRCLKAFNDISYDLGLINQSLRWGYETIARNGYTIDAMKMVARANVVNGYDHTVGKLIGLLEKTVNGRNDARRYRDLLQHPSAEIIFKRIGRFNTDDNLEYDPHKAEVSLVNLMTANPTNRMAFEYLMASSLLKADMQIFFAFLPLIQDYKFTSIPRHYQEAIILGQSTNNGPAFNVGPYRLDPLIQQRFSVYSSIVATYGNDPQRMQATLKAQFGDTYWYHAQFMVPFYHRGIQAMGLKEEGMYKSGGEL